MCVSSEAYVKIRRSGRHLVLAICDCELLGQTLREDPIVFHVTKEFYKGLRVSVDEAVELINNSTIVNMIGKNVIKKAVKQGYVHPDSIIIIAGVPHVQIVKF